ncbi:hypothetical protein SASPL_118669 [Salvia splendens]|uniref:D-isomer specific 2-hydroxyacid dehydrogenase catalytic domain-containing protein n=1 Tax=Salvia splendens TaxID=180675 RepID=A0A8X8XX64_SALSN|nr:hypothetical protein SASPL_118669 [Salvia splendens]
MYRIIASPFSRILRALVGENQPVITALKGTTSSYRVEAHHQLLCSSSPGLLRQFQRMSRESSKPITRVLFCGPHFPASHNYTMEYLQSYPFIKVDAVPIDEIRDVIGNYDICVVKSMRLNSDIIARANKMKLIMQFGVGLEGVDIDAATKHGIRVARIPSDYTGNATSCAEMAIYLMLGLLRKQVVISISNSRLNYFYSLLIGDTDVVDIVPPPI